MRNYLWQHIQKILQGYNGSLPLAIFLKDYFKHYPVLGSRDRKTLSNMAYSWYRCSKGIDTDSNMNNNFEGKMKKCLELCNYKYEWMHDIATATDFNIDLIFPYNLQLSHGISSGEWLSSILTQPALFIRVRKNKEIITGLLVEAAIPFTEITNSCLSLPNATDVKKILPEDLFVIQDASSQQTGNFFMPENNDKWYDCCSGAGGKSLLLKDKEPLVQLTISDKRATIIHNLKKRFESYHYPIPQSLEVDVADKSQLKKVMKNRKFDHIICDVPCSGSGTWARTPEQLYFFDPASVKKLAPLQEAIATNVSEYLEPGGTLYYITCSVFKDENEVVVKGIIEKTGMQLQRSELINGVPIHADSMFIAVLVK